MAATASLKDSLDLGSNNIAMNEFDMCPTSAAIFDPSAKQSLVKVTLQNRSTAENVILGAYQAANP